MATNPAASVRDRHPSLPFFVLGAGAALGFAAVYGLAVLTEQGQQVENLALLGAAIRAEADRAESLARLEPVGLGLFIVALATAVVVGYLRQRGLVGVAVALLMGIAVVVTELFKEVLARPELVDGASWLLRNSFPSGTAAVATAIAVGAILLPPDRLRWAALMAGAAGIAIVSHALQVSGWHRLSDVVGGGLIVIATAALGVGAMAAAGWTTRSSDGRVHPGVYRLILVVATGAIVIGALLIVFLAAFPLLGTPSGGRRVFLQVAFPLLGVGVMVLLLAVFARVLEPASLRGPEAAAPFRARRAVVPVTSALDQPTDGRVAERDPDAADE